MQSCSYSANSAGLNLQHMCRNGHLFEITLSEAILIQMDKKRPNIHIGLHYVAQAAEYATPNNCNVSAGESLHKSFKRFVVRANHVNVEKPLLFQESFYRTIQLLIEGAYRASEPALTRLNDDFFSKCPITFEALLNRPAVKGAQSIADDSNLRVLATGSHNSPRV